MVFGKQEAVRRDRWWEYGVAQGCSRPSTDGVLSSPGTICGNTTNTVFGNKTVTTNRPLRHGNLAELLLEAGTV